MTEVWYQFRRSRGAMVGLLFVGLLVVVAFLAPVLYPTSPWEMVALPNLPPGSPDYFFGTDMLGRDIGACLAYGTSVSLIVALIATFIASALGVILGTLAGYFGGIISDVIMRVTDFFQTLPAFVLAVLIVALFTPTLGSIAITIAFISWPAMCRLVRAECLTLRTREFVQAAILSGQSSMRVMFVQIVPNGLPPLIVSAMLVIGDAILLEAALAFLGLGDPNRMSWGYLIGIGRTVMLIQWWIVLLPGLAIFLTVLAVNLIGDGLTEALNPRLARGRSGSALDVPETLRELGL